MKTHFSLTLILMILFACEKNSTPEPPSNPIPADGSSGFSTGDTLSWSCNDPEGDLLTFNLYLGSSSSPELYASEIMIKKFVPEMLEPETKYYWKVVAFDDQDNESEGPVWQFITKDDAHPPFSGDWNVQTDFGNFIMTVNVEGTYITKFQITHEDWSCGGVTLGGSLGISGDPGWEILDGNFSFSESLDPNPFTNNHSIEILGSFNINGKEASGTWEEIVYGHTCSGNWNVIY